MSDHSKSPPWYLALVDWINGAGGHIHQSLELTNEDGIRGIACRDAIAKDELLIRLPASVVLSGESMPATYGSKHASPWLTCLAALCQAYNDKNSEYQPYLDSLPSDYEHLFQWTNDQVQEYLKGTTLGTIVQDDRSRRTLEERFSSSVEPYLIYTGALSLQADEKLEHFRQVCMVLSTRGFHLHQSAPALSQQQQQPQQYSGPYLLPFIDLLNHNPARSCTTLNRNDNGTFTMSAQRNLTRGEQVCHSYGNGLSSAQCLQTFGFVPKESIQRAATKWGEHEVIRNGAVTPAVISRDDLVHACREMIESDYPSQVQSCVIESGRQDEVWNVQVDFCCRTIDDLVSSEQLPIFYYSDNEPLSDELVTTCTLLLLPEEAFEDFMSDSPALLDSSILQDYYLGKLVCRSLLTAIDNKKCSYGSSIESDSNKLQQLYNKNGEHAAVSELRARYGLTIRIEEMASLDRLRIQVLQLVDSLDNADFDNEEESDKAMMGKRKRDTDE
jgi:hypothetical protein